MSSKPELGSGSTVKGPDIWRLFLPFYLHKLQIANKPAVWEWSALLEWYGGPMVNKVYIKSDHSGLRAEEKDFKYKSGWIRVFFSS